MSELAVELDCSPSTATRLCDRLVRKGLVSRDHPVSNRREVEVTATKRGRGLVERVTKRRRREIARIVAHVPSDQAPAMVAALRAFADAAGETSDEAWATGWAL
jgi:DNA-binding MarR family transcriptional regulator